MPTADPSPHNSVYTAFSHGRRVAHGRYDDIARALAAAVAATQADLPAPWRVFDDATGAPIDTPPLPQDAARLKAARAGRAAISAAQALAKADECSPAPRAAGRPRLGVVAREVTLLPRHWEWLSVQPGGASAALRRLIDKARKDNKSADSRRAAGERSYNFMSAIAGDQPQFEEAARALFAGDAVRFAGPVADWPPDVREYLMQLAEAAFLADDAQGSPE